MPDPNDIVFTAASFAARAHHNHFRKDKETPYFSHTVRVCLVVRHVFGYDDPQMLATALLHDTIEDTTTDYDDIVKEFGPVVAGWVAALSKDTRMPDAEREEAYCRQLAAADWQVKVIKLADQYDNLSDSATLDAARQKKTARRVRQYVEAVREGLPPAGVAALRLVQQKLDEFEARMAR